MADDLLQTLKMLEADYPAQPIVVQRADLREINQLRRQLGLPQVDAKLNALGAAPADVPPASEPEPEPDHSEARALYRAYRDKEAELEPHRAYADRVAKATSGRGQTPVRPLATMGTGGGPLLCDHCKKPIVLEGGAYHGVHADVAWGRNPHDGWTSWILGGLLVEIQTNGTLRIYHGYPGGGGKQCCNAARREDDKAREKFVSRRRPEDFDRLLAFLEYEFPEMSERDRFYLLNQILNAVFSYDPGVGVNRPSDTQE
jgi:hypothetical protein